MTATGKKGRILKEDVLKYLSLKSTPQVEPKSTQVDVKVTTQSRSDRTELLTPFQKGMVKTMTEALVRFVIDDVTSSSFELCLQSI